MGSPGTVDRHCATASSSLAERFCFPYEGRVARSDSLRDPAIDIVSEGVEMTQVTGDRFRFSSVPEFTSALATKESPRVSRPVDKRSTAAPAKWPRPATRGLEFGNDRDDAGRGQAIGSSVPGLAAACGSIRAISRAR